MKLTSLLSWMAALLLATGAWAQETPETPEPEKKPEEKPAEAQPERQQPRTTRRRPASRQQNLGEVGARYATYSPDGEFIAFSLGGDVWVMPSAGGRAERITRHEANDFSPKWSPDGKQLAFTSDRAGSVDVYTMDPDGGRPTRLTFDAGLDHVNGYAPDGKHIIFQSTRSGGWAIHKIPVAGGEPVKLTVDERATYASMSNADDWIYYQYAGSDSKVKGYRGTANDDIFRCKAGEVPEMLTSGDMNERFPNISPDGKTLYFIREGGKSGREFNLFSRDMASGEEKQLTDLDQNGIDQITFSSDFSKALIMWKFRIYSVDLSKPEAEPTLIPIEIVEDDTLPVTVERTSSNGAGNFDLSSDGRMIALEVNGAIWVMGAEGGQARMITEPGKGDSMPKISPDGRSVAFMSNGRSGNSDLWVIGTNGQGLRQLTKNTIDDQFHNWSPDGQWLVYAGDVGGSNENRELFRVMADGSGVVQLTNTPGAPVCDDPSVSPDGRSIAFDSDRDGGDRDIYIMDVDGQNIRRVHGSQGAHDESPRFSPDGRFLVYNRTSMAGPRQSRSVVVTDINGTGEAVIGSGHGGVFTADGREVLYLDNRGQIQAVPAPTTFTSGRTIPFMASTKVSQSEQFSAAFNEAWTQVNNFFYDKDFHGVSWKAMKDKYEPLVKSARTKMEFHYFVLQMIGELSASHQNISGNTMVVDGYNTGRLSAEWVPEEMNEKLRGKSYVRLKVTSVEKGGALDKAWVREGDYIFGVEGRRLMEGTPISTMLKDTTGKPIKLMVGTEADASNMRMVEVTPDSDGAIRGRDYSNMVRDNKKKTTELSDKKVSYIHIPQMNGTALAAFRRELSSKSVQDTKALVLDVRGNGGGNIHEQLFTIFALNKYAEMFSRTQQAIPAPSVFWGRPVVVLINERSYSDAEVFPHGMKTLGLGTIVGKATPGAVIGTVDITLSDGSRFRVTRTGFRNLDGKNQEHNGCQPDVFVDMTPEDRVMKRDPQLEKAIEIALSKIAEAAPEATPAATGEQPAASASNEKNSDGDEGEELPEDTQQFAIINTEGLLPFDPLTEPFLGE